MGLKPRHAIKSRELFFDLAYIPNQFGQFYFVRFRTGSISLKYIANTRRCLGVKAPSVQPLALYSKTAASRSTSSSRLFTGTPGPACNRPQSRGTRRNLPRRTERDRRFQREPLKRVDQERSSFALSTTTSPSIIRPTTGPARRTVCMMPR